MPLWALLEVRQLSLASLGWCPYQPPISSPSVWSPPALAWGKPPLFPPPSVQRSAVFTKLIMTQSASQTSPRVAKEATQANALPATGLSLLGLFGSKNDLQAMVRLPSGRVKTVKTGSRLAQGRVLGIDPTGLVLEKSGRNRRFEMPGR